MVFALGAAALALGFAVAARWRRARPAAARAVIVDPDEHTAVDTSGAVRSLQAVELTLPAEALERLWGPAFLERLARSYWHFLSRATLGIVRVVYTERERLVVLVARPIVLLRFGVPEYELLGDRGIVRWPILDGLLVARKNYGHLEIDVKRCESRRPGYSRVHVEVEVANFSPAIGRWVGRWVYTHTQSRIHVLVTHGFLRSLAKLELAESKAGRFAAMDELPDPVPARERGRPSTSGASNGRGEPTPAGPSRTGSA